MKRRVSDQRSRGETRRTSRRAVAASLPPAPSTLVPQLVTFGVLGLGLTAAGGGLKGIVMPPPGAPLVPVYLFLAVSFFVVAICMWLIGRVFTDPRFTRATPREQVKLARQALAPVLEILGLLQKTSLKPAEAA